MNRGSRNVKLNQQGRGTQEDESEKDGERGRAGDRKRERLGGAMSSLPRLPPPLPSSIICSSVSIFPLFSANFASYRSLIW